MPNLTRSRCPDPSAHPPLPHARHGLAGRPGAGRVALSVCALAALLTLSACGGSDGRAGGDHVASISSPSADRSASRQPSSAPKGVQLRLDSSQEEELRVFAAYGKCLKEHGVPVTVGSKTTDTGKTIQAVQPKGTAEDYPDAYKNCESKKPLPPVETDPKRNPHYRDDFRDFITCMNGKGLAVEPLADGSGWNYDRKHSKVAPGTPQAGKIEKDCRTKAFGGGE